MLNSSLRPKLEYLYALGLTSGQVAYLFDLNPERVVEYFSEFADTEEELDKVIRKTERKIYGKTKDRKKDKTKDINHAC